MLAAHLFRLSQHVGVKRLVPLHVRKGRHDARARGLGDTPHVLFLHAPALEEHHGQRGFGNTDTS